MISSIIYFLLLKLCLFLFELVIYIIFFYISFINYMMFLKFGHKHFYIISSTREIIREISNS